MSTKTFLVLLVALMFAPAAHAQQPDRETGPPPIEVGLEEQVEVQLVLVDFLVVDRNGRTVPDLTIDDFRLKVDGNLTEIHSLDVDCPIGSADELNTQSADPLPPGMEDTKPRKIVLVFDYDHMTNEAETYARVLRLLDTWPEGPEEHMIASFGEVVRIETPFTTDRDELRWAIRRMRNDRDLFAAEKGRLTESRFFDRVLSLMDILQAYEGRKTIVLMSGPFINDGWTNDRALRELSGMSTIARAAVYPVDTGGLRTPDDPSGSPFGGPPELRRLALETGGRMTAETNDITVAYARAQRDMRCTYTLGVYDRSGKLDNKRHLTLKTKGRKGLRVVYPQFFIRQSEPKRKKSLMRTAGLAPHMFESQGLRTAHFVTGAPSTDRWRTLFAVEIALDAEDLAPTQSIWSMTGFLRKLNGTVVERFERELVVPARQPEHDWEPAATLYHELTVPPGEYVFSVVLSAPDRLSPRSATHLVTLAQPPREGPFVIGPLVGRRADGSAREGVTFRPYLDPETTRGQPLDSMTTLCVVGAGRSREAVLDRSIFTLDGEEIHRYERIPLSLPSGKRVGCETVIDPVSTTDLTPGSYEIRATGESEGVKTRQARSSLAVRARVGEEGNQ